MNPGSYQRGPQMSGLLADFQYDESLDPSVQAPHPMFTSCDGLPRAPSQHLMEQSSLTSNILADSNFNLHQPVPIPMSISVSMSTSPMAWADPNRAAGAGEFETLAPNNNNNNSSNNGYYGYSPSNMAGNEHNGTFYRGYQQQQQQLDQTPRYMPKFFSTNANNNNNMSPSLEDSYEPSTYLFDSSSKPGMHIPSNNTMSSPFDYQNLSNAPDLERLSISHSPVPKIEQDNAMDNVLSFERPPPFGMPSSESSEEGNSSREMTALEVEEHNVDEPYAKLIYRALMSAPNRSMVLQEIYQWFRENTQKGSSDTKGWMNSIRHNLSMNAAFKKTERKTTGDDTKKSTEWVLEEFAVRDGVQSTTRYRKGTGAKKFIKSDTPATSRVVSGRKGGMSTKQAQAKLQLQQRQRSGGMSMKGDERRDNHPTRATQRIDNARRSGFHQQTRSQISQRQRSPLTPPSANTIASPGQGGPYFFPKMEKLDTPYEDLYRLEDVQGVFVDNGSSLFSNGPDTHFQGGRAMSNHRF
ncbi:hypothetical protein BKA65DRAFT_102647 [Rhexocercosporidium sp. MPI-PUGE-AT-0058]|nr:hypothetical protein BKA65DRAFT_102647 [Rhexocercosporidium sp. MPI-PUGE-AT-0058]